MNKCKQRRTWSWRTRRVSGSTSSVPRTRKAMEHTIGVFDELVDLGRAVVVTEQDESQLSGGRGYRLSEAAAEAHRQVIELRVDEADLN